MTAITNLDDDSTLELLDSSGIAKNLHRFRSGDVIKFHESDLVTPKPRFMVAGKPYWSQEQIEQWQIFEWLTVEKGNNAIITRAEVQNQLVNYAQAGYGRSYKMSKKDATLGAAELNALIIFFNRLFPFGLDDHVNEQLRKLHQSLQQKGY